MSLKKRYSELKDVNENLMLTLNQLQAKINYLERKCHEKQIQVSILKDGIKQLKEK